MKGDDFAEGRSESERLLSPSGSQALGFRGFINALIHERPRRLAWVITVQVATGLSQAVGVLLLVPLLGAVGVTSSGGAAHWIRGAFTDLGINPTLAVVLAIYVSVTAASAALNAYQGVLSTRYRLEFVDALRGRLYAAVARAEWRHLMTLRQSDLLTLLTSNVEWVDGAVYGVLSCVVTGIIVCAQLTASIGVSAAMTGLAVLTGVILLLVVWPLIRRSRRIGAELVEHNEGVMAMATGFLDGLKLAKAFGREAGHVKAFNSAVTAARGSQVGFTRASVLATGIQTTLSALLLAVTVYVSVRTLSVPTSSLLVVAFVFTRVVGQLNSLQTSIQHAAQGLPAFDETIRMIAGCEQAEEPPADRSGVSDRIHIGRGLALHDVHFAYPSQTGTDEEALRGTSLELPAGSLVALVGPSGAGKTTIADLAAGLIMPSAGYVAVAGEPLRSDHLLAWRLSVALVPQDPFLFHDTVEANLRWARPGATEREMWEVLRMASAAEFVGRLPGGLRAVVGDRGLRLSGGERQRLALARALLRNPDLLVLDEATNSLDTENELAIRAALSVLRGRTTILLIAHRLSMLPDADQIVVIDAGRVVETGTWADLSKLRVGRLQALVEAGAASISEPIGAA
jgi:ATP-binding cassette subfamily C protein